MGSGWTNDEATVKATRFLEPVVGVADDDLVKLDLTPIAEPDG
jgi:hypothetical protein